MAYPLNNKCDTEAEIAQAPPFPTPLHISKTYVLIISLRYIFNTHTYTLPIHSTHHLTLYWSLDTISKNKFAIGTHLIQHEPFYWHLLTLTHFTDFLS